jgi:hypothetical protein
MPVRHRVRALSCLRDMMNPESIEAAGQRSGHLPSGQLRPLIPRIWPRVLPLEELRSVPGFSRLTGLARKGGPGDLQEARSRRNPPIPLRRHGAHTFGVPQ